MLLTVLGYNSLEYTQNTSLQLFNVQIERMAVVLPPGQNKVCFQARKMISGYYVNGRRISSQGDSCFDPSFLVLVPSHTVHYSIALHSCMEGPQVFTKTTS